MQICPQFWRFCKFFAKKFSKSLPSVLKEGFYVGVRDRLSGDFLEALHEGHQVLDGDEFAGTMVEPVVNFLGCHDSFVLEGLRREWTGFVSGFCREWTGEVAEKRA